MVPSGIDEQGVDHGGLLLRLSHLPAADATQRRLELVGEGEVVAPQLKAPAPPRRRVGGWGQPRQSERAVSILSKYLLTDLLTRTAQTRKRPVGGNHSFSLKVSLGGC